MSRVVTGRFWHTLLLAGWLTTALAGQAAAGVVVDRATLARQQERLLLDAAIDYQLSAAAVEALDNGVPLTFLLEFTLRGDDAPLWELPLVSHTERYRLLFHALTARYLVTHTGSGSQHPYNSLEQALEALGTIRRLQLPTISPPERGQRYQAAVRVALDIEELPAPLRLIAYFSPAWRLESEWYRWSLGL